MSGTIYKNIITAPYVQQRIGLFRAPPIQLKPRARAPTPNAIIGAFRAALGLPKNWVAGAAALDAPKTPSPGYRRGPAGRRGSWLSSLPA